MTEFNNNNKFIQNTPQTYEVRYVENQEQSNLNRFADYLGIKTVECSGNNQLTVLDTSGGRGKSENKSDKRYRRGDPRDSVVVPGNGGCIIL